MLSTPYHASCVHYGVRHPHLCSLRTPLTLSGWFHRLVASLGLPSPAQHYRLPLLVVQRHSEGPRLFIVPHENTPSRARLGYISQPLIRHRKNELFSPPNRDEQRRTWLACVLTLHNSPYGSYDGDETEGIRTLLRSASCFSFLNQRLAKACTHPMAEEE